MIGTITKGNFAENLAAIYLESIGMVILERNWRYKHAEIDLIAEDKFNTLVFVEVKYRSQNNFGTPETFVTPKKLAKIEEGISAYLQKKEGVVNFRVDVVSVEGNEENLKIEYFQDVI